MAKTINVYFTFNSDGTINSQSFSPEPSGRTYGWQQDEDNNYFGAKIINKTNTDKHTVTKDGNEYTLVKDNSNSTDQHTNSSNVSLDTYSHYYLSDDDFSSHFNLKLLCYYRAHQSHFGSSDRSSDTQYDLYCISADNVNSGDDYDEEFSVTYTLEESPFNEDTTFIFHLLQYGHYILTEDTYIYLEKFSNKSDYTTVNAPHNTVCQYNSTSSTFTWVEFRSYLYLSNYRSFRIGVITLVDGDEDSDDYGVTTEIQGEGKLIHFDFTFNKTDSGTPNTIIIFSDLDTDKEIERITFVCTEEIDIPDSPDTPTDDNTIIEEESNTEGTEYSCIDYNQGTVQDSTSLLFKGNSDNIYKTIVLKDNTLFLGNYKEVFSNTQFIEGLKINLTDIQLKEYMQKGNLNLYTPNNTEYRYIPNTAMNSLQRHIFKKGETYNLGLVFITSTGIKSSVYNIGQWSPQQNPYISEYKLVKPVYKTIIDCVNNFGLKDLLLSSHIIGVMPVYTINNSTNVKCQGIVSPTLQSVKRKNEENIDNEYSWYQRTYNHTGYNRVIGESAYGHSSLAEIQSITNTDNNRSYQSTAEANFWNFDYEIVSLNTPEVECSENLTQAELTDIKARIIKHLPTIGISWIKKVSIIAENSYTHARMDSPKFALSYEEPAFMSRLPLYPIWYSFVNDGSKDETSTDFLTKTNDTKNYAYYCVYPWQRNKLGGEKPESKIDRKDFFDYMIFDDADYLSSYQDVTVNNTSIYRDFDTASILKIGSKLYQGNMDYSLVSSAPYLIWARALPDSGIWEHPKAYSKSSDTLSSTYYSGYNGNGRSADPITIRYKVAPHIVLDANLQNEVDDSGEFVPVMELYNTNEVDNSIQALEQATWIKCGNIVPINYNGNTVVTFEEGDWFYGRYDTLRTYPYSDGESNSVTEVVSAMLCSKVNLDLRTDRNRGIGTATITPSNFNRFNTAYDLLNTYFTFSYIDTTQAANNRNFETSILWSLNKVYGADTDNWCNIQSTNTLDLDGDKGLLICLTKNANNIVAFLETGISQILFNESVLVQSNNGTPIEIANSGKVLGKRYYTDNIGCQNINAITTALRGIYFIDSINKALYLFNNGQLNDITNLCSMKSWALKNLSKDWWLYYDAYSLEVILANNTQSLAFSDPYNRFLCFLNYEGIKHYLTLNGRVYLFQNQVSNGKIFRTWLKNGIDSTIIFGKKKQLRLVILANPEPTVDKTFSNIEYRADCFDANNNYLAWNTFDTLRVWDEYQDTGIVLLKPRGTHNELDNNGYIMYNTNIHSNLKKKFRIWRVQIPRVLYGKQKYTDILAEGSIIPDIITLIQETDVPWESMKKSRDRVRNPWCIVDLNVSNTNNYTSMVIHDIMIQYFT